ncbi:MAG: DUF748 domain-containing protein [Thermodesulfobacteriota bacterium]
MEESQSVSRWKKMSRWQRWCIIASVVFLLYTLFGFFLLPVLVRSQLAKQLTVATDRLAAVEKVTFNPYTLEIVIVGFRVQERDSDRPFVSFDRLQVNIQAMSLVKRALMVKSVSLLNPYVGIVLAEDGSFNFADLLPVQKEEQEQKKDDGEKTFLFSLNNIEVLGGRIDFADRVKKVDHAITGLHIGLPFLSNLAYQVQIFTKPAFAATVNGTALNMAGESIPFDPSRQTELVVRFAGIELAHYLSYLPDSFRFSLEDGLLDLDLALAFIRHEDGNPAVRIGGQVGLRQVKVVDDAGQPLLVFPSLTLDIERAHLLRREFHLQRIFWKKPEVYLERDNAGRLNLAGLVAAGTDGEKSVEEGAESEGAPVLFEAAEITIDGATVCFADHAEGTDFVTTLRPVRVELKDFSTASGAAVPYALSLTSESDEQAAISGSFVLHPLTVNAQVSLENIRPEKYRPYYDHVLAAEVGLKSSRLAAKVNFSQEGQAVRLSDVTADLSGIVLRMPEASEELTVAELSLQEGDVDLQERKVKLGQVVLSGGSLPLTLRKDKTITVQDFLQPAPERPAAGAEKSDNAGSDWGFSLKRFELADFAVDFMDLTPATPARFHFDRISLAVDNLSNTAGASAPIALNARLDETAPLKTTGSLQLKPMQVRLALDWANLPLALAQPYLNDHLDLLIGAGRAGLTGQVDYSPVGQGGKGVAFQGDLQSSGVNLLQGKQAEKLIGWKTLQVKKIGVATGPLRLSAGEIFSDGLTVKIARDGAGLLNLSKLAKKQKETAPVTAPAKKDAAARLDLAVDTVSLVNGTLLFSDSAITPRFDTSLRDIKGRVTGFSSRPDVRAAIELEARLDGQSPLRLAGSMQPWQDFFTDVTVRLGDVELSRMSPYTIKFIGYPLTKGKLNLNLHYLVDDKKLTAENKVFLDQITLGNYVKNDTAINAPVQLAISLLKNRAGEIDLDIPVSGRLDDPQFTVVGVVFKVIFNLIVKAATSPFALLGSLFEGAGEQQFVRFEAGRDVIADTDLALVEKLAKVLYERPAVKVDLVGRFDPAEDAEMLRRIRFERLLKTQKLKKTAGSTKAVGGLDAIIIAPEEYNEYLETAYKDADFERPKNFLGFLKSMSPAAMEKMLADHIVINEGDLRRLAGQRAARIKEMLVAKGPVEPARIFLVEPGETEAKEGEGERKRVDLFLR